MVFAGPNMQKLWTLQFGHYLQCLDKLRQIVPVNGTNVVPAEFLKQRTGCHHALHILFRALHGIRTHLLKDAFWPSRTCRLASQIFAKYDARPPVLCPIDI